MTAPKKNTPFRHSERKDQRAGKGKDQRKTGNRATASEEYVDGAIRPPLLNAAVEATELVLGFVHPADSVLSHYFRDNKTGARDRAFIAETAYAVVRRLPSLKRAAAHATSSSSSVRLLVLMALTRVLGYSVRYIEPALRRQEAEWLKAGAAHRDENAETLSLGERLDLPDWLAERLLAQMPESAVQTLMNGLNAAAPLDIRINTLKAERGKVLDYFAKHNIPAEACTYSPLGIRLPEKPALNKNPLFLDGAIEVQDEGSQLLSLLVEAKRGEMVVDFCAGAGGKTLQLGAMMRSTGRLYAFDVSDKRLAKLKPRMTRAGLTNVHPIAIASENDQRVRRLAGKIDRVLVDAPCSGLGTLRRNPDLKWRQSGQAIDELKEKQRAILAAAGKLVKPGGRLVYATCSVLDEENAAIVQEFLIANPEFSLQPVAPILTRQGVTAELAASTETASGYLQLQPHRHGCDGFFAAVMQRASS